MATLAGVAIADKDSVFDAGVALLLRQEAKVDTVVPLDQDWEVELRSGSRYVVARGKGATVEDEHGNAQVSETFALAYEAAQKGLDLLSVVGTADLAIGEAINENLVWWRENGAQVLRALGTAKMGVEFTVIAQVLDEQDNPKPQPPIPPPRYHECLRYFRLAQVTEDLFDAYRNLWLSFELLLSSQYPKTRPEIGWLRNALTAAHNSLDLTKGFQPAGSDIVSEIIDQLYTRARLPLFHATAARTVFIPHSLKDRETVDTALRKLTLLLLFLVEQWLSTKRPTGVMTNYGFDTTILSVLENSRLYVHDNDAPTDPSHETRVAAGLEAAVALETRHAPELSDPGRQYWMGEIKAEDLHGLSMIAGFVMETEGHLFSGHTIEAELRYDGIDRLEAQIGYYLENVRTPKYSFAS